MDSLYKLYNFLSPFLLPSLSSLPQAKSEYQRVMVQLMDQKQQHEVAIAEYKQVWCVWYIGLAYLVYAVMAA